MGVWGLVKSLVPHMDLPLHIKIPMLILMFPIEVLGLLIKHSVLAVRLLANMMAGHVVLAVIIAFIAASAQSLSWWWARNAGERAWGNRASTCLSCSWHSCKHIFSRSCRPCLSAWPFTRTNRVHESV